MNKKIAVHIDPKYPNSFSVKWIEYINSTEGYEAKAVNLKAIDAIQQVKDCAGVMWHFRHTPEDKQIAPKILTAIEQNLHIPVFPNLDTRWHFDEKVAQHYLFEASELPHIKSWVFWNYEEAKKFIETTDEYPLVYKLSCGAGSANVIKLDDKEQALPFVEKMFNQGVFPYTENEYKIKSMEGDKNYPSFIKRVKFGIDYILKKRNPPLPWYYNLQKNYIYFQKFIPDNPNDIRITVIGDRAFGFSRNNRPNDFRASGSGSIVYDLEKIPLDAVKLAFSMSDKYALQSCAYDILIDKQSKKCLISEIGYGYNSKAVYNAPGQWDRNLNWHEGHIWPQELHVKCFIKEIEGR